MRDLFRRKRPNRSSSDTILSQQQNELLAAELAALEKLSAILDAYPATDDDKEALEDAAEQLTSLFLLVVVGEFNAASRPSSTRWSAPGSCPKASPRPPR